MRSLDAKTITGCEDFLWGRMDSRSAGHSRGAEKPGTLRTGRDSRAVEGINTTPVSPPKSEIATSKRSRLCSEQKGRGLSDCAPSVARVRPWGSRMQQLVHGITPYSMS